MVLINFILYTVLRVKVTQRTDQEKGKGEEKGL